MMLDVFSLRPDWSQAHLLMAVKGEASVQSG
jgi:hypothetical protein